MRRRGDEKMKMKMGIEDESRRDSSLIARHEMPGCNSTSKGTPTGFNRTIVHQSIENLKSKTLTESKTDIFTTDCKAAGNSMMRPIDGRHPEL